MSKHAPTLWIVGGFLLMLANIIGNERSELIPIGFVFMVIGIASKEKNAKSNDPKGQ